MKRLFLLLLLSGIFAASCRKSERDNDRDTNAAEDMCRISSFENDINTQIHFVCDTLPQVNKIMAGCSNITVSGTTYPKTVAFDFGSVNCVGADGVARRGIITVVFSGKYRDSLTTITVTTNGYYTNDNKIDLTSTIVNKGKNSAGIVWFQETHSMDIVLTNQKTISFGGTLIREWTSGITTAGNFADDNFSITGSGSGTGSRGTAMSMEITDALQLSGSCRWISKGEIKLTPSTLNARYIDFGDGNCDNKADADVNGYITEITLP